MSKKGFTLIEIIVCIILLAIIGSASFVGLKAFSKSKVIKKLESITDKVLNAAEVYIETNKETYNQLYNKKNGVVIPLNVLVNEGLLDLSYTTLEDKDIESEYVIAALSGGSPTDDCVDIRTETSWKTKSSAPIYICTNKSTNSSSIVIGSESTNKDILSNTERTIISDYTKNYVKYNNKIYRLLYLESDDSLVIYTNEDTFGDFFKGKTQEIFSEEDDAVLKTDGVIRPYDSISSRYCNKDWCIKSKDITLPIYTNERDCESSENPINSNDYKFKITNRTFYYNETLYNLMKEGKGRFDITPEVIAHIRINNENKEQFISSTDYINLTNATGGNKPDFITKYKLYSVYELSTYSINCQPNLEYFKGKKVQLKSCIKIESGMGTSINPYILSDSRC